jgi:hypothetical protein
VEWDEAENRACLRINNEVGDARKSRLTSRKITRLYRSGKEESWSCVWGAAKRCLLLKLREERRGEIGSGPKLKGRWMSRAAPVNLETHADTHNTHTRTHTQVAITNNNKYQ